MPRVTVIVPAYNCAHYVREALASVQAQTVTDWEAIVVDDGSTDGTAEAVATLAEADPRIRLIRQANSGAAQARNRALAEATSPFVAFLDADDLWLADKLAMQLPLFDDPAIGLVCSDLEFIDGAGGPVDQSLHVSPKPGRDWRDLVMENWVANSSAVVRRAVLEAHDLRLRDERPSTEDWDLWIRIAYVAELAHVPQRLLRYRLHAGNISGDYQLATRSGIRVLADVERDLYTLTQERPSWATRNHFNAARAIFLRRQAYNVLASDDRASARPWMWRSLVLQPWSARAWVGWLRTFYWTHPQINRTPRQHK